MKKLRTYTAAKAVAVILTILSAALLAGCVFAGVIFLEDSDFYYEDKYEDTKFFSNTIQNELYHMLDVYKEPTSGTDIFVQGSEAQQYFTNHYTAERSALSVTVTDKDGRRVLRNYPVTEPLAVKEYIYIYRTDPDTGLTYKDIAEGDYRARIEYTVLHSDEWCDEALDSGVRLSFEDWLKVEYGNSFYENYVASGSDALPSDEGNAYRDQYDDYLRHELVSAIPDGYYNVTCAINPDMSGDKEIMMLYKWGSFAFSMRYAIIVIAIVSLIVLLACVIFLISAAGWRAGNDKPTLGFFERVPLLIYLAVCASIAVALLLALSNVSGCTAAAEIALSAVICVALATLGILMGLSLITRLKCGGWWRYTLIYLIGRTVARIARNWSVTWRIIIPICVLLALNAILALLMGDTTNWFFVMFLIDVAAFAIICFVANKWGGLVKATSRIAGGDSDARVDTTNMPATLRIHGENINSLGEGVSLAVQQQLRSERMRTDLITNVSHDLKTPLTSIINYVGLLKSEPIDNPTAAEYVDVLDRQAARLKHLVDDLVEASKASSGCIQANLRTVNVNEILNQALTEYADRLETSGVRAVLSCSKDRLCAVADGNLLWRVFDNLLSNACKYAQPGTRLYIDALTSRNKTVISFRNTSREPLNITADELMERFVRGDGSRSSEGSGLGLSIARSLIELQKGSFRLEIDGDLFKVIISLPYAEPAPEPVVCAADTFAATDVENERPLDEPESLAAADYPAIGAGENAEYSAIGAGEDTDLD